MKWKRLIGPVILASAGVYGSLPHLSAWHSNGDLTLSVSNVAAGGTYYIERSDNLLSNAWLEVYSFEGQPGSTNWMPSLSESGFFRAVRDPYHAKVGEIADFGTDNAHDVAGTAHIVNNRTIELRNFHFDGGGIQVEVWLSQSGNFTSDYISISGDLLGMVFNDATAQFEIPAGTDLDGINYISIWCVPFGASFGDGAFQ